MYQRGRTSEFNTPYCIRLLSQQSVLTLGSHVKRALSYIHTNNVWPRSSSICSTAWLLPDCASKTDDDKI